MTEFSFLDELCLKLGQIMGGKPLNCSQYEVFTFCSVKGNGYVMVGHFSAYFWFLAVCG